MSMLAVWCQGRSLARPNRSLLWADEVTLRCLKAPKRAVTQASCTQRVRLPCTCSSIPLALPLSKVHGSAQVSSLYKHAEKCLPAGFPTPRSRQVAAGSAGETRVPHWVPAPIGGSHGPTNHSFLGTALAWGCVTSPHARSIRGGSHSSRPGSPFCSASRNMAGGGSQARLPTEPALVPLHGQASISVNPAMFSYNRADSHLTHLSPGFCFPEVPP